MNFLRKAAVVASFGIVAAATPAKAEAPHIWWEHKPLPGVSLEECVTRAENAMLLQGSEDISREPLYVYGTIGDNRIGISCVESLDSSVAIVIVSGDYATDQEELRLLRDALYGSMDEPTFDESPLQQGF